MKTGIQFDKETLQPLTKPTTFRLMQVYSETEESFAGELQFDLADYIDVEQKETFKLSLTNTLFKEAKLELSLRASAL